MRKINTKRLKSRSTPSRTMKDMEAGATRWQRWKGWRPPMPSSTCLSNTEVAMSSCSSNARREEFLKSANVSLHSAEVQTSVGRDPKEYMRCTPEGRDWIQKIKLREDFNCSATCEGLHADVLFDTDPLNKMITRGQLDNAFEANNGNSKFSNMPQNWSKSTELSRRIWSDASTLSPPLYKPILVR